MGCRSVPRSRSGPTPRAESVLPLLRNSDSVGDGRKDGRGGRSITHPEKNKQSK